MGASRSGAPFHFTDLPLVMLAQQQNGLQPPPPPPSTLGPPPRCDSGSTSPALGMFDGAGGGDSGEGSTMTAGAAGEEAAVPDGSGKLGKKAHGSRESMHVTRMSREEVFRVVDDDADGHGSEDKEHGFNKSPMGRCSSGLPGG